MGLKNGPPNQLILLAAVKTIANTVIAEQQQSIIKEKLKRLERGNCKPTNLIKVGDYEKAGVMFPSSHDITPQHLPESIQFLKNILFPGNQILIVSKPHLECIKAICDEFVNYKDKILFRFTIGSSDNATLKFWEPGAPSFEERVASLKYAYEAGYATSISCEPMLDNNIGDVIDIVRPYVTHSIWLGKMSKMKWRLEMNTEITDELKEKANQLYAWQSDDEIRALYETYKNDLLFAGRVKLKLLLVYRSVKLDLMNKYIFRKLDFELTDCIL